MARRLTKQQEDYERMVRDFDDFKMQLRFPLFPEPSQQESSLQPNAPKRRGWTRRKMKSGVAWFSPIVGDQKPTRKASKEKERLNDNGKT